MQVSSSAETENKQAADNSTTESADAEPTNFQSKAKVQQAKENKVSYDITVYDSAENAKSANPAGKIASSPAVSTKPSIRQLNQSNRSSKNSDILLAKLVKPLCHKLVKRNLTAILQE